MPFIPHDKADTQAMLQALELTDINALYDEIPQDIPTAAIAGIPTGLSEMAVSRLLHQREPRSQERQCFIGAGAYEHYIPAAVSTIISRGEFYTAYTPYQAEASQGSLQVIFEFQQLMTRLLAMEVSNASMYDGATALAEACLMAIRIKRGKKRKILYAHSLHPAYQAVLNTVLGQQDLELQSISLTADGMLDQEILKRHLPTAAAVIISQPNFFGLCDDIDMLTTLAHQHEALVIAQVNPLACAWLKPPGEWGDTGADIACGEGQPLGVPLAGGGPYFGFMTTRKAFIRQLPGRIVGKTTDDKGNVGYTLTLQAREQHIRRAKATSNICTNQGLMVVAATAYLQLQGGNKLQQIAMTCHQRLQQLMQGIQQIKGVNCVFTGPHFHECVLQFDSDSVATVLAGLRQAGIQGGYNLTELYPKLGAALLVCTTETKTEADITHYLHTLSQVLTHNGSAA